MKTVMLPIDSIGFDPEFYPRVNGKEDWLTVLRYKEALESHAEKADPSIPGAFPACHVIKAPGFDFPHLLLDGLHRLRAFTAAGYEELPCVIENLPRSKWLARSVELNIDSKRPLDSGDKRWIAHKLAAENWKPERIAKLLCMRIESYDKIVSSRCQRITSVSGKKAPLGRAHRVIGGNHFGFLKSPFENLSGTANAQIALARQQSVSARNIEQIVASFAALLETHCLDLTDESLVENLRNIHGQLDKLFSTVN